MTNDTTRNLSAMRERQRARREGRDTAFRAAVEQRLNNLEEQVSEIKSRINGLIFLAIGTVFTQVILRLLH